MGNQFLSLDLEVGVQDTRIHAFAVVPSDTGQSLTFSNNTSSVAAPAKLDGLTEDADLLRLLLHAGAHGPVCYKYPMIHRMAPKKAPMHAIINQGRQKTSQMAARYARHIDADQAASYLQRAGPSLRSGVYRMSSLTGADKLCLETVLGMDSGYVLNLSNARFDQFFNSYGVDIHGGRYQIYGTSKANKMRAFWDHEPDDLVGRVLFGLLDVCEVLFSPEVLERDSVALKKSRAIAARLSGISPEENSLTGEGVPNWEIEIPNIQRLPVSPAVSEIIQERLKEAQTCLSEGAPLAAILLCGSVLEAVLLGAAKNEPEIFNRSKRSPKNPQGKVKDFRDWKLSQLIDVAYDIGLLKLDSLRFSHTLRDFRNYIHPEQQLKEDFKPDKYTSEGCLQALKTALADLADER